MKTSSTATGSGSNVSGGVWLPKGTILRGIMLIYRKVLIKKMQYQSHYFPDAPRIHSIFKPGPNVIISVKNMDMVQNNYHNTQLSYSLQGAESLLRSQLVCS